MPRVGISQRVLPMYDALDKPALLSIPPDIRVKRNSLSCSQYQSEDNSARTRKRSSLARRDAVISCASASAALRRFASIEATAMNNAEMNIPAISTTAGVSFSVAALNAASDANRMVQVWPPTSTVNVRVKVGIRAGPSAF